MLRLARAFLHLLLPPVCAGCRRAVDSPQPLCPDCDRRLPRWEPGPAAPRGLAGCTAAVRYEGAAEEWLRRFKYPRPGLVGLDPAADAVLRFLAREAARRAPGPTPELVVPVALHPRRLRARGFSPAAVLARGVAREIGAPVAPAALRRIRDTPSQTGLGRPARRRNLKGAFRVRPGLRLPDRIWLVDDVITTGATLGEAARCLRRAGARHVAAVCVAWTPEGRSVVAPEAPSRRR